MQKLSVKLLEPGMLTHGRVLTADGAVLLGSEVVLNANYIKGVKRLGVSAIFVQNSILDSVGLQYEETLSEDTKLQAIAIVKDCFTEAKAGRMLDVYKVSTLAKTIIESVKHNQLIRLDNSFTPDNYLYIHCVNVAALVTVIAHDLGFSESRLHELVMGALLHDIGIAILDQEKNFAFQENDEEHPGAGFEYVRRLRGYSTVSSHIVFQHHECYDGSGYPRRLQQKAIHEYARITAIADTYDLLISDWSGKHPLLPHEAYEALMSMSLHAFDKEIADLFLAKIPLYPVGTFVKLDTGHIGVVTEALPKLQSRPTLAIIRDGNGTFFDRPQTIDLTQLLTTFITYVLTEKEVVELTKDYDAAPPGGTGLAIE